MARNDQYPTKRYWIGAVPDQCDLCHRKLSRGFVDGRTRTGPWANMCLSCHAANGVGFGEGKGQAYLPQANGMFAKTRG